MEAPCRLSLVALEEDDLDELAAVLVPAGLPDGDLRQPGRRFYRAADAAGAVGFAGLEPRGADALLRSLVVLPERRGLGHGRKLLQTMIGEARRQGVARLWLLTETAAGLFSAAGFARVPRAAVPPAIQATAEFTAFCPASAACMVLDLQLEDPR